MMTRRLVIAILMSLSAFAEAAAPSEAEPSRPSNGCPEAAAAIAAANADWLPAMERADVATIVAPYADDAVFITVAGEALRGRSAIAELYRNRFASSAVVGGDIVSAGCVSAAPGLVYEWGHASLELRHPDGSRTKSGGAYLTVWRQGELGHWHIVRNAVF